METASWHACFVVGDDGPKGLLVLMYCIGVFALWLPCTAHLIQHDDSCKQDKRGGVEGGRGKADPLVGHAHVRLCRGGSQAGGGCLAQAAGIQAHLLANDHVHGLDVRLPQAPHGPCLDCLHYLPQQTADSQFHPQQGRVLWQLWGAVLGL